MNLSELAAEYWHIGVVALVLVCLSLDFLVRFFIRSFKLRRDLDDAIEALQAIRGEKNGELVELSAVETKAMKSEALSNPWTEYAKTLHKQLGDEDELGQQRIRCWRSTALAETFFTDQAIVDSRLKTDFFKHLPGVLTGLGIIGTFLGLIKGLVHFDVSVDPAAAQAQLQGLVSSVGLTCPLQTGPAGV
ncbi:hypothetical protein [Burkholderia cenocepacia]|nr:hypothetical protein [Burkholderia cenocepacia]